MSVSENWSCWSSQLVSRFACMHESRFFITFLPTEKHFSFQSIYLFNPFRTHRISLPQQNPCFS